MGLSQLGAQRFSSFFQLFSSEGCGFFSLFLSILAKPRLFELCRDELCQSTSIILTVVELVIASPWRNINLVTGLGSKTDF